MTQTRNKLYFFIGAACFLGYGWLFYHLQMDGGSKAAEVCMVKKVTRLPCPSCGTTRSVISILHGHFQEAMLSNPFGFIVFGILLLAPVWIVADLILNRNSFFMLYQNMEKQLKKPMVAIPLIFLVLMNWLWNFNKGL